jgi:hypothetical protein
VADACQQGLINGSGAALLSQLQAVLEAESCLSCIEEDFEAGARHSYHVVAADQLAVSNVTCLWLVCCCKQLMLILVYSQQYAAITAENS